MDDRGFHGFRGFTFDNPRQSAKSAVSFSTRWPSSLLNMKSLLSLIAIVIAAHLVAAEPLTLLLWPEGPPTPLPPKSEATAKQIQEHGGVTPTRVSEVTDPTITIYRPETPNGAAVIVAPGGGYMFLSYSFEGTQVCEWLNSIGVTAVLLKYRTPTRDDAQPYKLPVEDAQRALGIVRHRAGEWGVDPKRVGILGFSAGGNLAGHTAWDRGERTYPQKPDVDDPRGPGFLVFVYGGGFLDPADKTKFREGFSVPADAPPAFFVVAHDDKSNPIEAASLYLEYKKRDLAAELHIYTKGGHGFGMRKAGQPINDWPQRCAEWMQSVGILVPGKQ